MTEPDLRARPDRGIARDQDAGERPGRRGGFLGIGRRSSTGPQGPAGSQTYRHRGSNFIAALKRFWIPLLIVAVVAAGGLTVSRLHGIFGSEKRESYADTRIKDTKPFNPKHIRYEIFGPPGTTADISYFDVDGNPVHVNGQSVPWSFDISTTLPSILGNVVAQGNGDSLGCRIVVDGVVKAERVSHELNAFTYCMLTAT